MLDTLRERIAGEIGAAIHEITGEAVDTPRVEDPPRPDMGDLATPAVLQVAKRLGRNPRELAQEVVERLRERQVAGVVAWSLAGPGFINAGLDRGAALQALIARTRRPVRSESAGKVLVEHTSINPNKAAHVGHLRNACMGDTLGNLFRALGHAVEIHNYIDDTGVQVADVVIGFLDLRELDPEAVAALPEPFDYLCWDLYSEVSERMADDPKLVERRRQVLLALEERDGVEARMGRIVARRIVRRHIGTMRRLGIEYDVLVKEGDILTLDLWSEAFERLRRSDRVIRPTEGKHADCWVMKLQGTAGFEDLEEADKVLVRSNGTATYVAKDIAYHFWKYGLLERDFTYEPVADIEARPGGEPVWQTTHEHGQERDFGGAARAISVIDVRQSYLQSIVGQAFYLIDANDAGDSFTHFDYEMVALSPATARALGIPVEADAEERQFVEMSGGRGFGVKADDLLDELVRRAAREVGSRNADLDDAARERIGRDIAIGAARYFLLRFARNTLIVFDLDEALSFEGETGPYLQYAAVRAARIFDRLGEELGIDDVGAALRAAIDGDASSPLAFDDGAVGARLAADDGELWSLVLALGRYEEVLEQAGRSLEISGVAKYAFQLAQHFSRFYHGYPILQADDAVDRTLRMLVAYAFQQRLASVLGLLGIPLPTRM